MQRERAHLAAALQGAHDGDQLGGVGGRERAAALQDGRQLAVRDVADVQLQEARSERARQHLRSQPQKRLFDLAILLYTV